jgi:MoxR-like ATPase
VVVEDPVDLDRVRLRHGAQRTPRGLRDVRDRIVTYWPSHPSIYLADSRGAGRSLYAAPTALGGDEEEPVSGQMEYAAEPGARAGAGAMAGTSPMAGRRTIGAPGDAALEDIAATTARITGSIERVIDGKPDVVRLAVTVLLSEGHLLIEDVPGVGKTMLAKALARTIDCSVRRIQFTPDLLPSDVTGVSVYNQESREFEFKPGAIFANIVVGDEINRASPKTQSALLECMEERQVTVDGTTYELAAPFMVIATQNPIEMEGTYPLPEAQRDRFTARISMGYPSPGAELEMLDTHGVSNPLDELQPVTDAMEISRLIAAVRGVFVSDAVRRYAIELVGATRDLPELRLGASPRATLHLLRAARAAAALDARDFVLPDDIQVLAGPVLSHRLLLSAEAQISRRSPHQVVTDLLARIPVPAGDPRGRRGR